MDWTQSTKWYSVRRITMWQTQQKSAIAGLSVLPGQEAVDRILEYRTEANVEMAEFCMKRLVKRRQLGIV